MSRAPSHAAGLHPLGFVALPAHARPGGFDHAAVHRGRARLFVAHTANDAIDVIDTRDPRLIDSIGGLAGVAGALVDEASDLLFTSNRGEDTVGILELRKGGAPAKVAVGARPNGLAYDPQRRLLLCANVGDPARAGAPSVTLVDVAVRAAVGQITMPGRTRWAIHDPDRGLFFVNIADPPAIVMIDPATPDRIAGRFAMPARGPHGLDLDPLRGRLYCACDDARLLAVDAGSGAVLATLELSGGPDVVFLNAALDRLYVAIGDPGVIDVIDVAGWRRVATVPTETGAHTIGFDPVANRVYAFLPGSHRAAVFADPGGEGGAS